MQSFMLYLAYLTYTNAALYNSMENVTPLQKNNFTDTVKNGRWVVVFYRKSCGHCIAFSTSFSEATVYAKNWTWAVRFGAIDCENTINNDVCWKYKIQGVPNIKLFVDGEVVSEIESDFNAHKFLDGIVLSLIPELEKISNENKLKPRKIIIASSSRRHNARVMLDYTDALKLPMVSEVLPSADVMKMKTKSGMIIAQGTLEEMKQSLSSLIWSKVNESAGHDINKIDKEPAEEDVSPKFTPVYAADIFHSLSMLLSSDVTARVNISGEDMDALKEFIGMLSRTLPASAKYLRALRSLDSWLSDRQATTGREWFDQLKVVQLPIYTGDFIACKGSQPYLRGYPCGLWLLWHSLTVSHHLSLQDTQGDLVAHAMHRFMPRFFSCLYCAFHFALNSANIARPGESLLPVNRPAPSKADFTWDDSVIPQLPAAPHTSWEEVLWLNKVHNRVNKRLSGSPTDDPTAPKVVFPSVSACASCWAKDPDTGGLILGGTPESQSSLFNFLVTLYRPSSWHTVGLPSTFFGPLDSLPRYPNEFRDRRSTYSDLFAVAILSIILTALSVLMILFLSRFLWRNRCSRRANIT